MFLGARGFPVGDSSGDEEVVDEQCARTVPGGRVALALWLREKAANWNAELCKEKGACNGSMDLHNVNNLHLPEITPKDGCYESGFEKETCLRTLSSCLYKFQPYLEYIEETTINEGHGTTSIWQTTQRLANSLRSMMNSPDTVAMLPENQEAISAQLREKRDWNATVAKYKILQGFTSFMEKAARAICHLSVINV